MSAIFVLTERSPETGMRIVVVDPHVPEDVVAVDGFVRDDVVLTPHTAAYLRTAFDRTALACAENALAALDGTLDPALVVNAEVLRQE